LGQIFWQGKPLIFVVSVIVRGTVSLVYSNICTALTTTVLI